MIERRLMAACAALVWCVSSDARAEACAAKLTRRTVVSCILAASLSLERERAGIAAQRGRREAARPWLPANPQLSLSGAYRRSEADRGGNWYATLSQELEIAGQRGARVDAAAAATAAQEQTALAEQRNVAADAWRAYFEALAARDALDMATRLEQALASGTQAASAGAAQGLVSGVDAELTALTQLKLTHMRLEAEQRARMTKALLVSLLGRDPRRAELAVEGELTPLADTALSHALSSKPDGDAPTPLAGAPVSSTAVSTAADSGADVARDHVENELVDAAVARRPEVARAAHTQRERRYDITILRRSRVPNITLSLLAQRDGFGEHVLGGGLAVPIPLPHPLGRTFAGEISEAEARARQADAELAEVHRAVRLEIVTALQSYEAASTQRALFTDERAADAERSLTSIAGEIRAGRLPISSALVAQQTFIEFLRARIEAKLALCLASVELARSAGAALEGGQL